MLSLNAICLPCKNLVIEVIAQTGHTSTRLGRIANYSQKEKNNRIPVKTILGYVVSLRLTRDI